MSGNERPRVAFYARVSTDDKEQNPETQLHALRRYCLARGWDAPTEPYVDYASARDMRGRRAWRRMMEAAGRREFDALLVYRLDRAFRQVRDGVIAMDRLNECGVDFISVEEPYIDTTSPMGEVMFIISSLWAQLEGVGISQRVKAGMDRARAQGVRLGRPSVPVDLEYVARRREAGASWSEIRREHPVMTLANGRRKKPSISTIRRYYAESHPNDEGSVS